MGKIKKSKASGSVDGFPDKYTKIPGFVSCMQDMDTLDQDGLKKTIVEAEKSIEEVNQAKEADNALQDAKQKVKDLSGGYRDTTKYQNAKIKYALFCLERMGQQVSQ